ncbi:efflux RND transporter periplasmic adaptor subunit [Pelagibaculum spongiae]|uniref:CzcB-like barrel-sandwich hybrid domain-containing protein n=1 Tax=Pelagibaculum spongiae TaxID=2080658 RepID=A0A2V1GT49_9GAMM|nr:efflux RND transporter periplasmic adaptor subunit [Pelagibaculum spongiae]PVZ65691.1 hypothetical protein DC094_17560 [Pelagibaculum spongiae]
MNRLMRSSLVDRLQTSPLIHSLNLILRVSIMLGAAIGLQSYGNTAIAKENIQVDENQLRVTTVPASQLLFYPQRSAPAFVQPLNQSKLASQLGALLLSLPVKVGDQVTKGQILAQLNCLDYTTAVAQQQQQLSNAQQQSSFSQREWQRAQTMQRTSSISEASLDAKEHAFKQAEISVASGELGLKNAQNQQSRCQIKAPFSGVVSQRIANQGEWINVGQPIIELTQLSQQEVVASIAISDQKSFLDAGSYQLQTAGQNYPLKLRTLLPLVNSTSRSQQARLVFTNLQAINGLSGRLLWKASQPFLPSDILQKRNNQYGFFISDTDQSGNTIARFVTVPNAEEGRPFQASIDQQALIIQAGRFGLKLNQAITLSN